MRAHRISRQSAHEGGKVVSPTHRPPLPPSTYSWYSFLSEAKSTPGLECGQKVKSVKNSNGPIGNRARDFPAWSAEPQPTVAPRAPILPCRAGLVNNWLKGDCRRPACSAIEVHVWNVWERRWKFSRRITSLRSRIWNLDLSDKQEVCCPLENEVYVITTYSIIFILSSC